MSFSHSWHYNVLFLAFQCIPLGLEFQILYSTLGLIITFLPTNKLILCLRCICSSCHTCQRISYKTVKAVISARGHGSFKKSYFYVPRIGYWAESAGARSLRWKDLDFAIITKSNNTSIDGPKKACISIHTLTLILKWIPLLLSNNGHIPNSSDQRINYVA